MQDRLDLPATARLHVDLPLLPSMTQHEPLIMCDCLAACCLHSGACAGLYRVASEERMSGGGPSGSCDFDATSRTWQVAAAAVAAAAAASVCICTHPCCLHITYMKRKEHVVSLQESIESTK
jgi:hypothetical protein